jgi:HSP20 family molecular chaperone IbpA
MRGGSHPHHFHFPTVLVHHLKSEIEHVCILARPPPASAAPIIPKVNIRETSQTYHIEIEVPGVIDKNMFAMHWLSPRILLVRGDIPRHNISRDAANGVTQENEDDADDADNAEKAELSSSPPLQAADSDPPTTKSVELDKSNPAWEKLDTEWSKLMEAHEQDPLAADEHGLKRVVPLNGEAGVNVSRLLLSERKVGPWQRTFTLPLDVNMEKLKSSLNGGLLSIEATKRDMQGSLST